MVWRVTHSGPFNASPEELARLEDAIREDGSFQVASSHDYSRNFIPNERIVFMNSQDGGFDYVVRISHGGRTEPQSAEDRVSSDLDLYIPYRDKKNKRLLDRFVDRLLERMKSLINTHCDQNYQEVIVKGS